MYASVKRQRENLEINHMHPKTEISRPLQWLHTLGVMSVCACTLIGCSLFDRSDVRGAQYLIAPPAQAKVDGKPLGSMSVTRFSALPPYDRRAFLYHTADGSWRADTYNGFMSDPSDMVTESFAAALSQSGRATFVLGEGLSVRGDFSVNGVVERFYADYTDASSPKAIVELHVYLLDGRGYRSRLVGEYDGKGAVAIAGKEPSDVAQALSQASGKAIDAVIREFPQSVAAEPKQDSSKP
jgi:ABC-type uncharacterized transport system auxiliary subunit